MAPHRRTVLSALGLSVPFGLSHLAAAATPAPQRVRYQSFEEAIRRAFAGIAPAEGEFPVHRIEIGHSDLVQSGVQGCHNDRAFGGFPAGHLRIVRSGFEPGPAVGGVRLYVAYVDVAYTGGRDYGEPSRPLDFASLPAAPVLGEMAVSAGSI